MPDRQPLGDSTVHIAGDLFVANGGVVDYGGPAQGSVGIHAEGNRSWGATYDRDPPTPGVGTLQVDPLVPEINYSAIFSEEGSARWKGDQGK